MSAAQHTPGPWAASQPEGYGFAYVSEAGGPLNGDIATTWSAGGDALANAHLISAAPDMLAALREAEKRLRGAGMLGGDDDPVNAAIAEAEGRA